MRRQAEGPNVACGAHAASAGLFNGVSQIIGKAMNCQENLHTLVLAHVPNAHLTFRKLSTFGKLGAMFSILGT